MNPMAQKIKNQIKKVITKRRLGFLAIVLVVIIGLLIMLFGSSNDVQIGDTKLTQQKIDEYKKLAEEYLKENPNESFGADPAQVAADDLILNAAFKKEAKDRNTFLTVDDIASYTGDRPKNEVEKQALMNQFNNKSELSRVRVENEAYKIKFSEALLAKRDLVMVTANFDTPFFSSAPKDKVQKYYDQARQRMEREIEPLFKSKADKQAIADASDVSSYFANNKGDDEDVNPYYKKIVTHAVYIQKSSSKNGFNDIDDTGYIKGDVGKLYDTDEKIAELKNVGDYTGVFASKIGAYAIIRLEGKSGGEHNSWEDFLDYYKKTYVLSYGDKIQTQLGTRLEKGLNKAIDLATSPGLQKAQAHTGNHSGCGLGHHVPIKFIAINIDANTEIGGVVMKMHQPNNSEAGTCPAVTATRTTGAKGYVDFFPDYPHCYNGKPVWTIIKDADPSKYIKAENHKQHSYRHLDWQWRDGFPDEWKPEFANNTAINLRVNYKERPVTGVCTTFDVVGVVPSRQNGADRVKAGKRFEVTLAARNTGSKNWPGANNNPTFHVKMSIKGANQNEQERWLPVEARSSHGVTGPGAKNDRIWLKTGSGVPPGQQTGNKLDLWMQAPSAIRDAVIVASFYHDQAKGNPFLECETTVKVFEESGFSVNPEVDPPVIEDGNVKLTGTIKRETGAPCDADATRIRIYRKSSGANLNDWNSNAGTLGTDFCPNNLKTRTATHSISSYQPGEEICVFVRVNPGTTFRGPGGVSYDSSGPLEDEACSTVVNRPFVSAFAGDVYADKSVSAYTDYAHGTLNKGGSGSQLVALAGDAITGFASSIQRSSPFDPLGLTFNNQGVAIEPNEQDTPLGGDFGGNAGDINRFIDEQKFTESTLKNISLGNSFAANSVNTDGKQVHVDSGNVTLGGAILDSGRRALFLNDVDGDLYVTGNITYNSPLTSSFSVLVKGDIYIDDSVTQLDGLYYATGNIYTCRVDLSGSLPGAANHFDVCKNQLTVNGALTADNIYFERTYKTLRNSTRSNNYDNTPAAEKIIFSPEIFLVNPLWRAIGSNGSGGDPTIFDAYRALPPIL
jgi:hypothetical protein